MKDHLFQLNKHILAFVACAFSILPTEAVENNWLHATFFSPIAFRTPATEYAPFTRWWWPGNDVTPAELEREISLFASWHLGGIEIQPMSLVMPCKGKGRADRIMSFDTPSYYHNLSVVMNAAQQKGLTVDLTDGSGWPAGGAHISEQENNQTLEVGISNLLPGQDNNITVPRAQKGDRPSAKLIAVLTAKMTGTEGSTVLLDKSSVKNITSKVKDGKVSLSVKDKGYKLLAFWQMADMEHPMLMASRDAGFAMNHFDSTIVAKNYDHFLGARTGLRPFMGKTLRALFNDSYEFRADRHFSDDFIATFKQNRSYDPTPFLPANIWYGYNNMYERMAEPGQLPLFGFDDQDWRLRYDFDLTLSDLLRKHFLLGSRHWLESRGMLHRTQTYGLNMDMMGAAGDASIPEMETLIFAKGCESGFKIISSGAHLYNRPIVSCETAVFFGRAFLSTPQKLKMTVDKVLTSGANQIIWHGTPYSYFPDGYPKEGWYPFFNSALGVNFATFFSEKNLFWPEFRDINIYAQRAQYLMRCGKPQADMLIYYPFLKFPENVYNPKELLISGYLPGVEPELTKDDSRPFNSDTETNWMQQIWSLINGLNAMGITWDWVNDESLQQAAVHADNSIDIRGNHYQALILHHVPYMQTATAHAIKDLATKGARIMTFGDLPQSQPSYHNWQEADADVQRTMMQLSACKTVTSDPNTISTINIPLETVNGHNCFKQIRRVNGDGSIIQMYWNESYQWHKLTVKDHRNYKYHYWLNAEDGNAQLALTNTDSRFQKDLAPLATTFLYCSNKPIVLTKTEEDHHNANKSDFRPDRAKFMMELGQWTISTDSTIRENQDLYDWRTDSLLRYSDQPCTYSVLTKIRRRPGKHYFIDLGRAYYVASLSVNGYEVGKRLFTPFLFDITRYLHHRHNLITVRIKPSMYNALVKRGLDGNRLFKSLKNTGLAAEGLAGPVRIYEQ